MRRRSSRSRPRLTWPDSTCMGSLRLQGLTPLNGALENCVLVFAHCPPQCRFATGDDTRNPRPTVSLSNVDSKELVRTGYDAVSVAYRARAGGSAPGGCSLRLCRPTSGQEPRRTGSVPEPPCGGPRSGPRSTGCGSRKEVCGSVGGASYRRAQAGTTSFSQPPEREDQGTRI